MKTKIIYNTFVRNISFWRQFLTWKSLVKHNVPKDYIPSAKHLLIMPADSETIGGSRGDEAMIMATIRHYKRIDPNYKISIIITNGDEYLESLNISNLNIIPSYRGSYPLARIFQSIIENRPSDVVVVGADCMDGHYAPFISLTLLAVYDLCSRVSGINTSILGFSWNKRPSYGMKIAFSSIKNISLNVRDVHSLHRLKKDTGHNNLRLVADEAFMLEADEKSPGYSQAETLLSENGLELNIGFNFHPMLREYKDEDDVKSDALAVAKNLKTALMKDQNFTLMFISHDDRRTISDNTVLDIIYNYLCTQGFGKRVYYDPIVYRSAQIKGICKLLDGLISSRMHLAIAALGMSKPIMAISYQDKFEGLYSHFTYDKSFLMTPEELVSGDFSKRFHNFITSLPILKDVVETNLPKVLSLSEMNLAVSNCNNN